MFTDYKTNNYIYKNVEINKFFLNSLFRSYGYCIDPLAKENVMLKQDNIESLRLLAIKNKDYILIATLDDLSKNKSPSPKMQNDNFLIEITTNDKRKISKLSTNDKEDIIDLLNTLLHIGFYLAGWEGENEPYLFNIRKNRDKIRAEMKCQDLIENMFKNMFYPLIKNFPIIYYQKINDTLKASVIDNNLTIDKILNSLFMDSNEDENMCKNIIFTTYYYLTIIIEIPLPMIEPFINSVI